VLKKQFGDKAGAAAKVYAASNDDEAVASAGDLAGDTFIAYSTWKWIEMEAATGQEPVYRFRFDRPVPLPEGMTSPGGVKGLAGHSWELEYVFGELDSKKAAWGPEDRKTSEEVARLLGQLHQDRQPQRRRPAQVARLQQDPRSDASGCRQPRRPRRASGSV
jgi:carboxylesterase type B